MEQHLSFSPLDPILPPPTLDLAVGTQSGRGVVLEAALPSPSVLFVGRSLPLRLFLRDRRLHMGSNSPRIALRSLAIAIQMKTTMAIGLDRNTWTSNRVMVSVSAMEPPRGDFCASMDGTGDQLLEISSDLWKHATVPVLPSSFTTCAVRRQYSVVVTVGLVSSSGEALDVGRIDWTSRYAPRVNANNLLAGRRHYQCGGSLWHRAAARRDRRPGAG